MERSQSPPNQGRGEREKCESTAAATTWQTQAISDAVEKADLEEARFIPHARVVARVKQLSRKLFEPGW